MRQSRYCTFCQRNLFSEFYYCCDENVACCFSCTSYGCHICNQPYRERSDYCRECYSNKRKDQLLTLSGFSTCVACCRKKFDSGKNQRYHGIGMSNEKERYNLYLFIKKYCTKCNSYLQGSVQEDQNGIKQILPLHNNLCQTCKNPHLNNDQVIDFNKKDYQIGSPIKPSNSYADDSRLFQQKCISCDITIYGSYTDIEGGGRVCRHCCKQSNENEKVLDSSRIRFHDNEMQENKENIIQNKEGSKIKSSQSKKIVHMSSIQRQQKMKKSDSQELLQKIPLDIKFDEKEEFIECHDCGYHVQAIDSIWLDISDTQNVPLCRCCFTDIVTNSLRRTKKIKYKLKDQNKDQKIFDESHHQSGNSNNNEFQKAQHHNNVNVIDNQPIVKQQTVQQTQKIIKKSIPDDLRKEKQPQQKTQDIQESSKNHQPEQNNFGVQQQKKALNSDQAPTVDEDQVNLLPLQNVQLQKSSKLSSNKISEQPKGDNKQKSEQQTQVIKGQIKMNKNEVKKLQVWDEQNIQQPPVDHERKKETIQEAKKQNFTEKIQAGENITEIPVNKSNLRNDQSQLQSNKKSAKVQNFIEQVKKKQLQQKPKYGSPITKNYQQLQDTVDASKNNQSKYSYTSDKLTQSKINPKNQIKKPEISTMTYQNQPQKFRSPQKLNNPQEQLTMKNQKIIKQDKLVAQKIPANKNIHAQYQTYPKQPSQNSNFYASFPSTTNVKKLSDVTDRFAYPSTAKVTKIIDGNDKYIPQSQRTSNYISPTSQTYHYSNLSKKPPVQVIYQEATTNKASTNAREIHTEQKRDENRSSLGQRLCNICRDKIFPSQRTFTLQFKAICQKCFEGYKKKKEQQRQIMNFNHRY